MAWMQVKGRKIIANLIQCIEAHSCKESNKSNINKGSMHLPLIHHSHRIGNTDMITHTVLFAQLYGSHQRADLKIIVNSIHFVQGHSWWTGKRSKIITNRNHFPRVRSKYNSKNYQMITDENHLVKMYNQDRRKRAKR